MTSWAKWPSGATNCGGVGRIDLCRSGTPLGRRLVAQHAGHGRIDGALHNRLCFRQLTTSHLEFDKVNISLVDIYQHRKCVDSRSAYMDGRFSDSSGTAPSNAAFPPSIAAHTRGVPQLVHACFPTCSSTNGRMTSALCMTPPPNTTTSGS